MASKYSPFTRVTHTWLQFCSPMSSLTLMKPSLPALLLQTQHRSTLVQTFSYYYWPNALSPYPLFYIISLTDCNRWLLIINSMKTSHILLGVMNIKILIIGIFRYPLAQKSTPIVMIYYLPTSSHHHDLSERACIYNIHYWL